MKWRLAITLVVLAVFSLTIWAQDATPTPEPKPICPAFPNESTEIRTSYYMGEGLGYYQSNQLSSAEHSFSCVIEVIDADYVAAYMSRAMVYTGQRFYDKAIEDYNEAIQRNPQLTVAYNNRGILYTAVAKYDEAKADFTKVLSIDSNNLAGYNNQAVFQAIQGDLLGAIDTLQKAIEISGIDKQYTALSDPKRAPDAPKIEVDPIAARAYALLGIMYSKISLQNYDIYTFLMKGGGDYRIADAGGALESRFTFDMRLEDGTWWLTADYNATAGQ